MNAPFYFSKLMTRVLGPFLDKIYYLGDILIHGRDWNNTALRQDIRYYLDDILIHGRNWKNRLVEILIALKESGLTVKLSKYLGIKISAYLRHKEFPVPRNVHEV